MRILKIQFNQLIKISRTLTIFFILISFGSLVSAEELTKDLTTASNERITTAEKLESLKKEVLSVNRDLFILEEDLLFPASTQIAVYVSLDMGVFFELDNIKLKLDDQDVSHFLYTKNDVDALYRGAIQKLYLGNLSTGKHQLVAIAIGRGPHKREFRNAVSFDFVKSTEAKALEIQIKDDKTKQQPKMNVIEW